MPLYIDVHEVPGASEEDLVKAHLAGQIAECKLSSDADWSLKW